MEIEEGYGNHVPWAIMKHQAGDNLRQVTMPGWQSGFGLVVMRREPNATMM